MDSYVGDLYVSQWFTKIPRGGLTFALVCGGGGGGGQVSSIFSSQGMDTLSDSAFCWVEQAVGLEFL